MVLRLLVVVAMVRQLMLRNNDIDAVNADICGFLDVTILEVGYIGQNSGEMSIIPSFLCIFFCIM